MKRAVLPLKPKAGHNKMTDHENRTEDIILMSLNISYIPMNNYFEYPYLLLAQKTKESFAETQPAAD